MSMTPAEVQKAMDGLKSEFLPKGYWFSASIYNGDASIGVYDGRAERVAGARAPDWPEALEKFRTALIAWSVERDMSLVRRVALAIIDLTDAGVCDMEALMKAGFTAQEIDRVGAKACELAAKMTAVEAYSIHTSAAAAE
jgi:hypothetical protein